MGIDVKVTEATTPEQACPVAPVVDIVFSRWTTPILWVLNEFGRLRFVELAARITTITPKVLTQRLRRLRQAAGDVTQTFGNVRLGKRLLDPAARRRRVAGAVSWVRALVRCKAARVLADGCQRRRRPVAPGHGSRQ